MGRAAAPAARGSGGGGVDGEVVEGEADGPAGEVPAQRGEADGGFGVDRPRGNDAGIGRARGGPDAAGELGELDTRKNPEI